MHVEEYRIFPKVVLVFDDQKIKKTIDVNGLIADIDFVLQDKIYPKENPSYPGYQTQSIFWRKNKWWEKEYNTDWDIIKQSFEECCMKYIHHVYPENAGYTFPTHSKCWAVRGYDGALNNPIHNHSPATLSGVMCLKNTSNIGTEFYSFNDINDSYIVNANELDWIIFPSNLYHRAVSVTDNERYILACDFYLGVD